MMHVPAEPAQSGEMFLNLKQAGIANVYRNVCAMLMTRGMAKTVSCDPYTGNVDLFGAIVLSLGGSEQKLLQGETDIEECGLPAANVIKALLAIDGIEAHYGMSLTEIQELSSIHAICITLFNIADRIDMTVATPPVSIKKR